MKKKLLRAAALTAVASLSSKNRFASAAETPAIQKPTIIFILSDYVGIGKPPVRPKILTGSFYATKEELRPPTGSSLEIGRGAAVVAAVFALILAVLKIAYAVNYRVDSDEPQHLHTVWAWANGLLPYRDVFDNHAPLFQMLCAPLFRALGERENIVVLMRFSVVPLYLIDLALIYRLVEGLYSKRAAVWTTVLLAFFPPFFLITTEFRTDDLWTTLWLVCLVIGVRGRFTTPRSALCGLILGACFATSIKTGLMVVAALTAAALVFTGNLSRKGRVDARRWLVPATAFVGAMLVFPAGFLWFFVSRGSAVPIYYCLIEHNLVPGLLETGWVPVAGRPFYFPVALLIMLALVLGGRARSVPSPLWRRRLMISLLPIFYVGALWSYFPVLFAEHYSPFHPMLFAAVVPLALGEWRGSRAAWPSYRLGTGIMAALLIGELAWLVVGFPPWQNRNAGAQQIVRDVLSLTTPDDYVMDGKAASIYRRIPFYYILETMTDARIANGSLRDSIPEQLIRTRAPVAIADRLYPRALGFVKQNYVRVTDSLSVLGQYLHQGSGPNPKSDFVFQIEVPNRYIVVGHKRALGGDLDGSPLIGARWLGSGQHRFVSATPEDSAILIWAAAAEKGYFPLGTWPEGKVKSAVP